MLGEQPGQREDLAAYRQLGGYRPLAGADELLSEVESSGLLRPRRRRLSPCGEIAFRAR